MMILIWLLLVQFPGDFDFERPEFLKEEVVKIVNFLLNFYFLFFWKWYTPFFPETFDEILD